MRAEIKSNDTSWVGKKIVAEMEGWDFGGYYVIKYVGSDYLVLMDSLGKEHIRSRGIPFEIYQEPQDLDTLEDRASDFAEEKHKFQKDDDGVSYYFSHLYWVAAAVKLFTKDPEVIAAAYLHDTLEDTDTTFDELQQKFGPRVAGYVYEMTHQGQKDNYGFYFPNLHSKEAILIKFADRMSNLSRMQSWDEERQNQYLKRSKFWKDGRDR